MLTQEDLLAIGNLFDEKLEKRFADYDKKMDTKFAEHDAKWEKRFVEQDEKWDKRLEIRFAEQDEKWDKRLDDTLNRRFTEELKPIKRELRMIRKDMKLIVKFFNDELHGTRTRVDRLEDYLHVPPQS